MAISKPEKYNEGMIRGKKVFLIGAVPVLIFLVFVGIVAFVISNFVSKFSVNANDDVCNSVRRRYPTSISSDWPCEVADKGDYFLVTFNQSVNTGEAAALMSFKYNKVTKQIEPAITVN